MFQFPANVLSAVAAIPDGDIESVATTWAETEELQMDGWTVADAAEFIGLLRAHAQRGVAENASMFLWISV